MQARTHTHTFLLWQVLYPDEFNYAVAACPDPIGFTSYASPPPPPTLPYLPHLALSSPPCPIFPTSSTHPALSSPRCPLFPTFATFTARYTTVNLYSDSNAYVYGSPFKTTPRPS